MGIYFKAKWRERETERGGGEEGKKGKVEGRAAGILGPRILLQPHGQVSFIILEWGRWGEGGEWLACCNTWFVHKHTNLLHAWKKQ